MSYAIEASKTRSEKITLVTVESVERVKLFTSSALNWTRVSKYFIVGVKDNGASIATWSFSPTTKVLTIIGGADPKTRSLSLTYRHFYSNSPVTLPYDLTSSGEPVEWEARVTSVGSIGQQLDSENTGIVLESSSTIDLENTDGYFDSFFDTHIWENQAVKFYSWFPTIPVEERLQLFEGVIETKMFSDSKISFRVKDFVFKLKNFVDLVLFSNADGIILPSIIGTPKRRVYGQVDNMTCVSIDATLDGFTLTGTLSINPSTTTVTGTLSTFLSELSPEDEITTIFNGELLKFGIGSITSNTAAILGKEPDVTITDGVFKCRPRFPYRGKNRTWMIAGHKLRAPSTAIANVIGANAFTVASTLDFYSGDLITVNGIQTNIRRISGNTIVTQSAILPLPVITNLIEKRPVQEAFFGKKELIFSRDYTTSNTTESFITLDSLAEFNISEQRLLGVSVTFTNGSRSITTVSTLDFRSILKSRDWIRSSDLSKPDWYEILQVNQQEIILRTAFTYTTATEAALIKNVEIVDENSLMTISCLGMEADGLWVRTASDAVRNLILNDAEFSVVNESTFTKANADCNYTLSMVLPESIGDKPITIRDVITKINNSVFGSLYGDSTQNISYSILNSTKPELSNILKDDDILSFSVETDQKIVNVVSLKYSPYVDINNGEDTFKVISFNSGFVDSLIGIKNSIERTVYLYKDEEAETLIQRIALFNSMGNSTVKLKAKMNLSQVLVNDKIYLQLDRLFSRYGGLDQRKLGTVTGVKRNGYDTELSVVDLGNIYNRVPSLAPIDTPDYSLAISDDKIKWGFILDNDTLTADPTSEEGLGNYIIG